MFAALLCVQYTKFEIFIRNVTRIYVNVFMIGGPERRLIGVRNLLCASKSGQSRLFRTITCLNTYSSVLTITTCGDRDPNGFILDNVWRCVHIILLCVTILYIIERCGYRIYLQLKYLKTENRHIVINPPYIKLYDKVYVFNRVVFLSVLSIFSF